MRVALPEASKCGRASLHKARDGKSLGDLVFTAEDGEVCVEMPSRTSRDFGGAVQLWLETSSGVAEKSRAFWVATAGLRVTQEPEEIHFNASKKTPLRVRVSAREGCEVPLNKVRVRLLFEDRTSVPKPTKGKPLMSVNVGVPAGGMVSVEARVNVLSKHNRGRRFRLLLITDDVGVAGATTRPFEVRARVPSRAPRPAKVARAASADVAPSSAPSKEAKEDEAEPAPMMHAPSWFQLLDASLMKCDRLALGTAPTAEASTAMAATSVHTEIGAIQTKLTRLQSSLQSLHSCMTP